MCACAPSCQAGALANELAPEAVKGAHREYVEAGARGAAQQGLPGDEQERW